MRLVWNNDSNHLPITGNKRIDLSDVSSSRRLLHFDIEIIEVLRYIEEKFNGWQT